jgi:two-component system, OmpR family, response regulator
MNSSAQLRVLVVDDNRDTADALAWLLQNIGHEVRAAYDAASAIRAFEEFSPDVMLQDVVLPGRDGLEIAREIRKRPASNRAFLVAITGLNKAAARYASALAAFDHLIAKPVGLKELKDALVRASSRLAGLSGTTDRSNAR